MRARHICAVAGIAAAVGAVVFMQSLVATNDYQAIAVAERLLDAVPFENGARQVRLQLDFRPDGRVLQGPPIPASGTKRGGRFLPGTPVLKREYGRRRNCRAAQLYLSAAEEYYR